MSGWTRAFETETCALVQRLVDGNAEAWRTLMVRLAPRLEAWAAGSRVLRRCRLTSEDDARAVMVDVLERLAANDYANLKRFLARTTHEAPPDDLVTAVLRLGKLDEPDEPGAGTEDNTEDTPLRAWLIRLVDFAARDHVRHRLGWGGNPGDPTKRDLHSDAAPLDAVPEPSARPPMTDRLTVSKLVAEVQEHINTFPAQMRDALMLWLDDVPPADIAKRLSLDDTGRAKALVRAGQARLRERFRGRSPLLFA